MRLVIVTFATLVLAWYELSGGAAFEPGEVSVTLFAEPDHGGTLLFAGLLDRGAVASAPRVRDGSVDVARTRDAVLSRVSTGAPVRVDLDPSAIPPATPAVVRAPAGTDAEAGPATRTGTTRPEMRTETTRAGNRRITLTEVRDTNAPDTGDLRRVTDQRVPLFEGPGRDFPARTELLKGETVTVTRDGATGWVQILAVDGGAAGWVEARHLTPAGATVHISN